MCPKKMTIGEAEILMSRRILFMGLWPGPMDVSNHQPSSQTRLYRYVGDKPFHLNLLSELTPTPAVQARGLVGISG
jgi:hypothetical protein